MCSNTGNNDCGCGTGSNGAVVSIWSSSSKKQQKRPRVPKRGPGVAELEKILREQESIDTPDRGTNDDGFSFSHHSNPYHSSSMKSHPLPPPPPSPPPRRLIIPPPPSPVPHVPSASKSDHLGPTTPPSMTSVYGGYGTALGRIGGSSLVFPGQDLLPINISSCKSKSNLNEVVDGSQSDSGISSSRNLSGESNQIWSHSASIQKRSNQYPPPMMNQFLGAGTPATSGSLPIGLHNHIEPPSNQSSYYNPTSKAPEEHKVAGMNRFHHPPLDNSLIPPPTFQVPLIFSNFNRPKQLSINDSQGGSSFTSANGCYKDAKWGNTLELNSRKLNSETVVHGHANFPPFASHDVHPPPMHLFQGVLSKGNALPYQVNKDRTEDSNHRSESSASDHRPFYNFLEVKDPDWGKDVPGANRGRREAGSLGIDLSLKL